MPTTRARYRLERIGLGFGLLLAAIAVILLMVRVLNSDQGPLEPLGSPTAQASVEQVSSATPATPQPTSAIYPVPLPGSLPELLRYAPDRLQDGSLPLNEIVQYADIQRWMAYRSPGTPSGSGDPIRADWDRELQSLTLPEVLATRGSDQIWQQTYGFRLEDVHQVLAVGSAPDYVMILRGDFTASQLQSAWVESGYQAVRLDGITYWSLYPGGSVDLSAPASRPALGNMNNLVLLDGGTLIATARSGRMEQTIRAYNGTGAVLADNPQMQALLAPATAPEEIVTAVILKGEALEKAMTTPNGEGDIGSPEPVMPTPSMFLVGLTTLDQDQPPQMIIVTSYDSTSDATLAQIRVQEELMAGVSPITGRPYSERAYLQSDRVYVASNDQGLLWLQFRLTDDESDWISIVEDRDFGYLMWP